MSIAVFMKVHFYLLETKAWQQAGIRKHRHEAKCFILIPVTLKLKLFFIT